MQRWYPSRCALPLLLCTALLSICGHCWDVASTPPMGFNTWNLYGCGVDAEILMRTADAMVSSGLKDVGYEYVNSDDCWMLAARNSKGQQVADPSKFPNGFAAVAAYIHQQGLKSGLYTAKGNWTCQRRAASCMHEMIDAQQWAEWGIDYVKDDSCSQCFDYTDDQDYGRMWKSIQSAGRPMVLTVEANPIDKVITKGGYGNAKRVGHDISPYFQSMLTLIDIGSGLWPFAHNSTNSTFGGWWNDLDMLEIGNAPDFLCGSSDSALARCRYHFSMWTIMKAVLLLGNDMAALDNATKSVVANKAAISINQDPLGIQAKRVAVQTPQNTTLLPNANFAVIRECQANIRTQDWAFKPLNKTRQRFLYIKPCNPQDEFQQWDFYPFGGGSGASKTALLNTGSMKCVDGAASQNPVSLAPCSDDPSAQSWTLDPTSLHIVSSQGSCLDVDDFSGPTVDIWSCKPSGNDDSNQKWSYDAKSMTLQPASNPGYCLAAEPLSGGDGGTLSTVDPASGQTLCLTSAPSGFYQVAPCPPLDEELADGFIFHFSNTNGGGPCSSSLDNCTFGPGYNMQEGASGPWPNSRYLEDNGGVFNINGPLSNLRIVASDHVGIINDNLVGNVTNGGLFCLDAVTAGVLEVWAGPLEHGKIAVAVTNRSPGVDTVLVLWSDIGASSASAAYSMYDVWAEANDGTFIGHAGFTLEPLTVRYFILTPVAS